MVDQECIAVVTTLVLVYGTFLMLLKVEQPIAAFTTLIRSVGGFGQMGIAEVRTRITAKRQEIWLACASLSAVSSELYCMMQLGVYFFLPEVAGVPPYKQVHFWTALLSSMCLRWATTCGCNLSPRTIQAITVLINVVGLVNRRDLPQLFVPANYAGRFFIGSFSPDPTFAAWVNFLLLPAFVAVGCSRLPQGSWVDCLGIFVNEVIVVVFMVCVLGQINSTTYQQEVATMELEKKAAELHLHMTETENILSAARKLLSVTCDCCEKLSHEWDIVEPTQRVLELLRYPGARKGEKPPTLSMRQCIALSDQDRFSTFVSSSGEDNNTATSLHLRMKDFSGKAFDAQLFHVNVPSLLTQHPQHLVGIIATSRHNDAIPSIPEGGVLSGVPESASDSRSQSACSEVSLGSRLRSAWVADAASLEWQVLTAKFQDWLDSVDHVELTLDLSTGSEGYAVRRATVHLKEVAPGEDPGTTLYSMIKPKYQIVVEDWISEHMNSWYHGIPCDEHCLGIKINLPMLGSVLVGDMAVSSIKEREHEDELHLEMAVELRNFLKATGNARESGP